MVAARNRTSLVVVLVAAIVALGACRRAVADLAAYWSFNEGSGTTVTDSMGGNVGTLTNGAAFSTDSPAVIGGGSSILLDGTNDSVIVPDSASVSPTGNITLSAWYKSPGFAGTARNILAKDSNSAYRWRINSDGELWMLVNDGGGLELAFSGQYASTGGWHHTAVSVDFTDNKIRFYHDGALVATNSTTKNAIADTAGSLVIGAYNPSGAESFNGNLDEVAIWSHRLSNSQIAALASGAAANRLGVTLLNPSFEEDTFTTFPGYSSTNGPITGWTSSHASRSGLNPAAGSPFANNGTIPDGSQVAFLQRGGTTLSQSAIGFDPGKNYIVTYQENSRSGYPTPDASASIDAQTVVATHSVPSVGGSNPYRYVGSSVFQATATSHALTFSNDSNPANDATVVLDNVGIHQVTLLFGDNFDVLSNNYDINPLPANDEPGRRSGLFASAAYHEQSGTPANFTQVDNGDFPDALLVAPQGSFGTVTVSPNADFSHIGAGPRHYVVNVDMDPIHATNGEQGEPGDWAAVVIGASSQEASVNTSDGIGFLIRGNGGYQIFDGTDGVNNAIASGDLGTDFGIDENGYYDVRLNYFVPEFDDATSGMVAIFVDDVLIRSFETDSGFARNFVNLVGYGPRGANTLHGFDNFQVWGTSVPEPSTVAMLVGLGVAGLLGWLRRRKRL